MRRDKRFASAVLVALATVVLSGCGADDSASNATSSSPGSSAANSAANSAVNSIADSDTAHHAATSAATPILNASSTLAANPAAASDPITQNMQASLAADSRQVAPVMHYAPGDSATSN